MIIVKICKKIESLYKRLLVSDLKRSLGYCGENVVLTCSPFPNPQNVFLYDDTNIYSEFTFINENGHFIMKKGSGAAQGLTVITETHTRAVGKLLKDKNLFYGREGNVSADVVVEEDVWIGANVTILSGVNVGRGATVGAGSVCIKSIPPYAIVLGNPAKVIGFNFSPDEIVEHEKKLYAENDRLPYHLLEKNYKKYCLDRAIDIKNILK